MCVRLLLELIQGPEALIEDSSSRPILAELIVNCLQDDADAFVQVPCTWRQSAQDPCAGGVAIFRPRLETETACRVAVSPLPFTVEHGQTA